MSKRIKKATKKYVAIAAVYVLVTMMVISAIIGVATSIKKFFVGFWEDTVSFFTGESRIDMEKMIDTVGEETLENFPISPRAMNLILDGEKNSFKEDTYVTIQKEIVTRTYGTYVDQNGNKNDVVSEETTYQDFKETIEYYNETYEYRTPWQLILGLAVCSAAYDGLDDELTDEELEEYYNQLGEEEFQVNKSQLKIKKKVIKDLIEILKPEYAFYNNFRNHRKYSWENMLSTGTYLDYYRIYSNDEVGSTTIQENEYTIRPLIKYAKNYYMETVSDYSSTYKYYSNNRAMTMKYKLDNFKTELNYDKFIEAFNYVGMEPEDLDLLIEFIQELPDAEALIYRLKPMVIDLKLGEMGYNFNANIPIIEGNWTRADLLKVASSLQGLYYFFGAKYNKIGANPSWGKLYTQKNKLSSFYNQMIPYGLDCSGYVDWVYYQMTGMVMSVQYQGYSTGTQNLWAITQHVEKKDLRPGDLGFYKYGGGIHVGIYYGKIDNVNAFIHCGGSSWGDATHPSGQVIITKQYNAYNGYPGSEFKYFRRLPVNFLDD